MARRGIMLLDSMIGLGIIAVLIIVLSVAMTRQQRASRALAERRVAIRAAEAALSRMQTGQSFPEGLFDAHLTLQTLPDRSTPAGYQWVRIEAKVNRQQSDLIGLVPATQPTTRPAAGASQ